MRSVELFAGAGGLAMGVSKAGFTHDAVIEFNRETCVTVRENQVRGIEPVTHWPLHEMDVSLFDYRSLQDRIDLVAGGPPCQPFSMGGKHRGHLDERNMFPEAVRSVRELRPKAFIFENVKGLLRESFSTYLEYIILQLTFPEITRGVDETWEDHQRRLERQYTAGRVHGLSYNVVFRLLNSADYGVPQKRERVVIVGFRKDLEIEWSYPEPTHSLDALAHAQWISGEYWEEHGVSRSDRPLPPLRLRSRLNQLHFDLPLSSPTRWRTVRDAIVGLPDPRSSEAESFLNHRFMPGARSYAGHTGSPLDEAAKTLKAGDHGVPGGENMVALPDGSVRYFTIRESARLQTFPDNYVFPVSWSESMRQLGNAVPVTLGHVIASSVRARLESAQNVESKRPVAV
ncbi:MAG: DNA cytosine methyltransferase [Capsulimonas sp.]|uniref:DNA cytosine methyltransferase n=1 Tax=Capsulimonas sp. TaxID=2494211 RepID=UPI0032675927